MTSTNRYRLSVSNTVQLAVSAVNDLGESPKSAPILLFPVLTSDLLSDSLPKSAAVPVKVQYPDLKQPVIAGVYPELSNDVPIGFVIVICTNRP